MAHATPLSALLLLLPMPSQPQGSEQPWPEKQTNQINSLHQIASHKSSTPCRALQKVLFLPSRQAMAVNGHIPLARWPGGDVCHRLLEQRHGESGWEINMETVSRGTQGPAAPGPFIEFVIFLIVPLLFCIPFLFLWCRIGFDSIFLHIALQPAWRGSTTSPSPVVMLWSHPGTS